MTSLSVVLLFASASHSQDIHFSQYLSSPAILNPAFTGDFKGDYRLTGNFRNQWNSITVPYRTVGLTVDAAHFLTKPNLGVGISIYDDLTGDSEYNTTTVVLSGAYAYPLTRDSAQKIHFGLQPSYVLQSLNTSALYFDNQYNGQLGKFDPTLPSGEAFSVNNVQWVTMAAGLRYSYVLDSRNKLDVGLAGFNLIGSDNTLESSSTRLQRRYNFHGNVQFKALQKLDLIPGFLYTSQGKSKNLISGISGRYLYNASTAIHAGFWYRNRDAGFFTAGLTYQTLYIGLSYDMTTSKLREASNGRGAFELSIIYVFRKFRMIDGKYMTCPNYL
ncbi:MAG: PorP/SprF family type IX secretion system membrane protein [Vicingaceae bacterium]